MTYRVGWFSTARGPTSRLLLREACEAMSRGDIPAEIAFVFCNRERGEAEDTDQFLDQAAGFGLPLVTLSSTAFRRTHGGRGSGFDGTSFAPWRTAYDQEVLRLLQPYNVDIAVLAGYMLVMTPPLCRRFTTINLHPAAPGGPVGTWQQVIWALIAARAPASGAYMHLVTPELDQGPVVTYCTYSLRGPAFDPLWESWEASKPAGGNSPQLSEDLPLFKAIRQAGVAREVPLVLETIRAFSTGELRITGGLPVDASGKPVPGYDLTLAVEERIKTRARPG